MFPPILTALHKDPFLWATIVRIKGERPKKGTTTLFRKVIGLRVWHSAVLKGPFHIDNGEYKETGK